MGLSKEVLYESQKDCATATCGIAFQIGFVAIIAILSMFSFTILDKHYVPIRHKQECGIVKLYAYAPRPNTKLSKCISASYNEEEQLLAIQKCCEK